LKASKGEDRGNVRIDEFGDYLISLGLCPNLSFLYKVIGMILRKPISEVKTEGRITREEFIKLFHPTPKTDLLLQILDNTTRKHQTIQSTTTQGLSSICKQIFSYIKVLVNMQQRAEVVRSEGEKFMLERDEDDLKKRIIELYSVKGFNCINNLAKRIVLYPESISSTDKTVKKLIMKEYLLRVKNNVSAFCFPHESIIDHYVVVVFDL
jgi:hypothetical protein